MVFPVFGTAKGTRTPDLLIRSQSLYPTELSPHVLSQALGYNNTSSQKMQVLFSKFSKYFFRAIFCPCLTVPDPLL